MGRLSTIYNSILLFEGRKEKARERYPMISDIVFNHYVNADPSGNQKYLDWMLGTTLSDSKHYQNNDTYDPYTFERGVNVVLRPHKRPVQYHIDMVDAINYFHNNQQRFDVKDINRYKSLYELEKFINLVKKKVKQKELDKRAKQERDIVYNDDRWLVISPKSHLASCKYGAGTKWCVTTKDSSSYWEKYSKNAIFYFILDKTKEETDPLYKVAYRLLGASGKKFELWNAKDIQITTSSEGREYYGDLPGKLKESINIHHAENAKHLTPIEDDPRAQAIMNATGTEYAYGLGDTYFGLEIYETDEGGFYVATTEDYMDQAMEERLDDYDDEELLEYYDYDGYFLDMWDKDAFAEDEAEYVVDNYSLLELLEMAEMDGEYHSVESELEDLHDNDEEFSVDKESELLNKLSIIEYEAIELVKENFMKEYLECLEGGVADCLVNERGLYNSASQLLDSGLVFLDRDSLIDHVIDTETYELIAYYGYEYVEDDNNYTWIVFEIDY